MDIRPAQLLFKDLTIFLGFSQQLGEYYNINNNKQPRVGID